MAAGADERPYPKELVESVTALSRLVVSKEDVASTVGQIARLAVHAIDGAEVCSISMARNGVITTVASTADIGNQIDALQYETGEGPCLSSIDKQATFHIQDMHSDTSWPAFSKRVVLETGVQSMLAYVLTVHEGALGALNLTSSQTASFSREDVATGSLFAAQAGVALANALSQEADQTVIQQLEEGLQTRQLIGQAVGLVMAAENMDPDQAFQVLVRISQSANVKIRELAKDLIAKSGESNSV